MENFKKKNKSILSDFYNNLFVKYSGSVPKIKLKEFVEKQNISDEDKITLVDIFHKDKLSKYSYNDLFDVELSTNDDVLDIIDDIDVSSEFLESSKNTFWNRNIKVRSIEKDEAVFFDYIRKQVRNNELEYFTVNELVNVLINGRGLTKTYSVEKFLDLFIEALED